MIFVDQLLESHKFVYKVLKKRKYFNICLIQTVSNVGNPARSVPEHKQQPPGQRSVRSSDQGQDKKEEEVEKEGHYQKDCEEVPLQ